MTMTTNPWDTRHGLQRTIDRPGRDTTQSSPVETSARETRLKRLILVGALASFLSIFGLTIAVDHQQARVPNEATVLSSNASSNASSLQPNGEAGAAQPQIRTRTS
jgi:hypothetical protein